MTELAGFVGADAKVVASQAGDPNSDGMQDVVVLLDHAMPSDSDAQQPQLRSLLFLVRDSQGRLHKRSENQRAVPCSHCGGTFGDPFGYIRLEGRALTILIEGGSREHWSDEYGFEYSEDAQDWLLTQVVRQVSDSISGQDETKTLTQQDFGRVTFANFDPARLPKVALP